MDRYPGGRPPAPGEYVNQYPPRDQFNPPVHPAMQRHMQQAPREVTTTGSAAGSSHFVNKKDQAVAYLKGHQASVNAWIAFLFIIMIALIFLSDLDISVLLTISSLCCAFSFLMVARKIESVKSCRGVSLRTAELYALVFVSRLFAIVPFEGYLPYDRTGDWVYQTSEFVGLVCAALVVFQCRERFSATHQSEYDSVPLWWVIVPAMAVAAVFHPNLNNWWPSDVAWMFALCLEALACLPQLVFLRKDNRAEPFMIHFIASQVFAKLPAFVFWLSTRNELNDYRHTLKSWIGAWVICMQAIQFIFLGDFTYRYVKCRIQGKPVHFVVEDIYV